VEIALTDQVRTVLQKQNRIAAGLGSWLTVAAPIGSFSIAHFAPLSFETPTGIYFWIALVACLVFSSIKVFKWAKKTYGTTAEGAAFVGIVELLSLAPHGIHWTITVVSAYCLLILVVINAVTGAVRVALDQKHTRAAARAVEPVQTIPIAEKNTGRKSKPAAPAREKSKVETPVKKPRVRAPKPPPMFKAV
jgi:hypothetical protein